MSSTSHFISKTVEDIREAFLEEIRCSATFIIDIIELKQNYCYLAT